MRALVLILLIGILGCSKKEDVAQVSTDAIYEKAKKLLPEESIGEVRYIKEAKVYEVETKGLPYYLYFFGDDGKYFVYSDLNLITNTTPINLTAELRAEKNGVIIDELKELDDDKFLAVFKADKNTGKEIYVFADIFCGYCKMFHTQVPELNKAGITVKYLGFPFLKPESNSALISVYCAEDRQKAYTDSITTGNFTEKSCPNPIANHITYARGLVVQGTPYVVLSTGEVKPGYAEAKDIIKMFE